MARSRRRRTTSQSAAGLIALALPAPIARVADTRLGSLILLVGVPAMLIFGMLNIKMVDGFPTFSFNADKAAELRRAASQHLNDLEHQSAQQNWGVATEFLHAVQGDHNHNPTSYNPLQLPSNNPNYLTQQQQQQAYEQTLYQQQQNQRLHPQQNYQQQNYQQQNYNQQGYAQPNYQQPSYPQQPTYQPQAGYQQQPVYQQPNAYQSATYQQQAYQQPYYPTSGTGQTAQYGVQPVPIGANRGYALPSSSKSSQLPNSQYGQYQR